MQLISEVTVEQINSALLALQSTLEALQRLQGTATITIKNGDKEGSFSLSDTTDKTIDLSN